MPWQRLAWMAPILLGVSIVAFALMRALPGDFVQAAAGTTELSPEARALLRAQLGLDQPVWAQYLQWLSGALRGDFGLSFTTHKPVIGELLPRLAVTAELTLVAGLMALLMGATSGLAAARLRHYALTDCLARSRAEVLGLATMIDAPTGTGLDGCDLERLRTFMIFTNDLDQSRGQRFADTHAELVALFAEAGLPWSDETRHAHLAPHVHRHLPVLPALDESSAA